MVSKRTLNWLNVKDMLQNEENISLCRYKKTHLHTNLMFGNRFFDVKLQDPLPLLPQPSLSEI